MAAGNIWTRIVVSDDESTLPPEHAPISIHTFGAAMIARAVGDINDATFIAWFSLDTDGQADFTALKAAYTAVAGNTKYQWLAKVEGAMILLHEGLITEAQAKTALGIA